MNWEKLFFSKLVIAVPEIGWNDEVVQWMIRNEFITDQDVSDLRYWRSTMSRYTGIVGQLSGPQFAQRLLLVAPELISVRSINLLRRLGVVDDQTGHVLRLLVGSMRATGVVPGVIPTDTILRSRLSSLAGVWLSQETVDLLRMVPLFPGLEPMTVEAANFLRGMLIGSERLRSARVAMRAGDGIIDRLILFGADLMNERFIKAGVLTGAISPENARILMSALRLGKTAWRTSTRVWSAAGFEQRALLTSTGLFSSDMISFLRAVGLIDRRTAATLNVAARMYRQVARTRLDAITQVSRAYRVLPGEAPIATFARTSRYSDKELISLLEDAAKATNKRIAELAGDAKWGARTRAAQERILRKALYDEIHDLWEGVGYVTINGERAAAMAAVDSMDFLARNVWRRAGSEADLIRRQLREAGRAGIDSLISREENIRPLSGRIYKNLAWAQNQVTRRIQINLIRGVSAKEFAADVATLFRPSVRGGVSYAAMRLARTEINNAFHMTSIRYTREMPWVQGYKWNLSATHAGRMPRGDVCNDYASRDEGHGPGVYGKRNVPSKPHPQCLCFITVVTMPPNQFRDGYRRGTFSAYFAARRKVGLYDEAPDPMMDIMQQHPEVFKVAGTLAGKGALAAGTWLFHP